MKGLKKTMAEKKVGVKRKYVENNDNSKKLKVSNNSTG